MIHSLIIPMHPHAFRVERLRLLHHLVAERYSGMSMELQRLQEKIRTARASLQEEYDKASLKALSSAKVVGMTTSGVAKQQHLVAAMKPRVSSNCLPPGHFGPWLYLYVCSARPNTHPALAPAPLSRVMTE